jgi:hypothetical protein
MKETEIGRACNTLAGDEQGQQNLGNLQERDYFGDVEVDRRKLLR